MIAKPVPHSDLPLIKCPSCTTPLGQWILSPGSAIRIKCRRCGDYYEIRKEAVDLTEHQMAQLRISILEEVRVMIRP